VFFLKCGFHHGNSCVVVVAFDSLLKEIALAKDGFRV
jgi:hypothetical protein